MAEEESSFSVFPNPASDRLQIRFTNETEAVIVLQNLLGEEIQRSTVAIGSKELTLNTSALASGSYILTVVADGVRASSKIEIVR